MSLHRSFLSDTHEASRQCVETMMQESPAYDRLAKAIGHHQIGNIASDISELHSRRNLGLMSVYDIRRLISGIPESRHVFDDGLPELITETEFRDDHVALKVVGVRNAERLNGIGDDVQFPCIISLKGPQSLYGTGCFPIMDEACIPDVIAGGGASIRMPQLAITRETADVSSDQARTIASYIEGFVSYVTITPVTGGMDKKALDAGRKMAERTECPESFSARDIIDKAVRNAYRDQREALPSKRAPKSTDVFSMDY